MRVQEEHGFVASMDVPVRACRFAERLNDAANGWRFGTADKLRLAAADMIALAFKLAAAFAAAEIAVEAWSDAVPVAEPETMAVKFACAVARAEERSMPALGLAKFPPSNWAVADKAAILLLTEWSRLAGKFKGGKPAVSRSAASSPAAFPGSGKPKPTPIALSRIAIIALADIAALAVALADAVALAEAVAVALAEAAAVAPAVTLALGSRNAVPGIVKLSPVKD